MQWKSQIRISVSAEVPNIGEVNICGGKETEADEICFSAMVEVSVRPNTTVVVAELTRARQQLL